MFRIDVFIVRATLIGSLCALVAGAADAGAPTPPPESSGPHTPEHQIADLGPFTFESGATIDNLQISYVTYGYPNASDDNVILAMHGYTADHHAHDFLIGSGNALDPDKYFIVATDALGNINLRHDLTTGPTSSGLNMAFPEFTIRDSVNVEVRFLKEYMGFDRILAAIGQSMGGNKAIQLAVSHPEFAKGIIGIVPAVATDPHFNLVLKSIMNTIALDSGWYGGNYQINPSMGVVTALMNFPPWLYAEAYYSNNLSTPDQVQVFEKLWLDIWGVYFPADARDLYYMTKSVMEYSISDTPGFDGDAGAALDSIVADTLLIGAKGDLLVPREHLLMIRDAIPGSTHFELDSQFGHLICCGFDPEATEIMGPLIDAFLSELR